jgi:hypothetical protein
MKILKKLIIIVIAINIIIFPFIEISFCQKIEDNIKNEIDKWIELAKIAWRYFEPGVGVNEKTGLHKASLYWSGFTDWDLGGYLITILYAEKIGLINKEGEWGADKRIEKVLDFLERRELKEGGIAYWEYDTDGKPLYPTSKTNPSDSGRLLIALYMIKKYKPYFSSRIDNIVYKKHNYSQIAMDSNAWKTTSDFYAYYVAHGFKFFGFDDYVPVANALNELNSIRNREKVNVYGMKLPKADITMEPLLHIIFELEPNEEIMQYTYNAYLAQELRYKNTNKYTAWSEGNAPKPGPYYVYEWIVLRDGRTWIITPKQIIPITYIKAAIGLHALFNTNYTKNMVDYIISKFEVEGLDKGFYEGVNTAGEVILERIDKTNTLIIEAAYYAIKKLTEKTYKLSIQNIKKIYTLGEEIKIDLNFSGIELPCHHTHTWEVKIYNGSEKIVEETYVTDKHNYTIKHIALNGGLYTIKYGIIINYNGYNISICNSTDVLVYSAQISSIDTPLVATVDTLIKITINVEYIFIIENSTSAGVPLQVKIIDKEENQVLAINETKILNESGIIPIKFSIKTPNIEKNWELIAEVYYKANGEWIHDEISGWKSDFSIEIKKQNITQTEIYVLKYKTITQTIIKTTTEKFETTKTIIKTSEYLNNLIIVLIGILIIAIISILLAITLMKERKIYRV